VIALLAELGLKSLRLTFKNAAGTRVNSGFSQVYVEMNLDINKERVADFQYFLEKPTEDIFKGFPLHLLKSSLVV
jgi:hypothetical protein